MKCPICNAWTQVLRTDGTRRRRECANEHRFTTREAAESEPVPWTKLVRTLMAERGRQVLREKGMLA